MSNHENAPRVICPHCDHEYTDDDMHAWKNDDLWAMAPREELAQIVCPSCKIEFFIQGGYRPEYTTTTEEPS